LDLQRRYPDRIRLLLPETNLGMMANFVQILRACTGDYIALLEGDDYWIDDCKLQKQNNLLDARPDLSACFTRAQLLRADDPDLLTYFPGLKSDKETFATEDLIEKNPIATASIMYRKFIREIDFTPLMNLSMGDWPLHILASLRGPIRLCPEVMAVYRLHQEGVWTKASELSKLEATVRMYEVLVKALPAALKTNVTRHLGKNFKLISTEFSRKGQRRASLHYLLKSLTVLPLKDLLGFSGAV
jgi:glycosyltransferase involved in cell wall biosynthesis